MELNKHENRLKKKFSRELSVKQKKKQKKIFDNEARFYTAEDYAQMKWDIGQWTKRQCCDFLAISTQVANELEKNGIR